MVNALGAACASGSIGGRAVVLVRPAQTQQRSWPMRQANAMAERTTALVSHVQSSISLIPPVSNALNHARYPVSVVSFIVCMSLVYTVWDVAYLQSKDRAEERRQLQQRRLLDLVTQRCVEERDTSGCQTMAELLQLDSNSSALTLHAPPAPPTPPTLPHPADADSAIGCWSPGAAVEAAGASGLSTLTAQQAVDVYAKVALRLRADALRTHDVHAFVHETADLNKDGALSIPEVYLALPRLVHASAWNDAHLELLWQGRCCGRP